MILKNPYTSNQLYPGNIIKLNRFKDTLWILRYGWFSYNSNRLICGWYLVDKNDKDNIKPFQLNDFDDIYLVEDSREDGADD